MKKTFLLTMLTLSMLAVSGCMAHPRHPHDGHFCPPGQAKKGNC